MPVPDARPNFVPSSDWLDTRSADDSHLGPAYLLLLLAIAAGIRIFGLTQQSLWVDEIMSWAMMRPGAGLGFLEQVTDAIQGPLYLALTWPLLRITDSPLMLRLVPCVAGILSIPVFALAVQRALGGRTARLAGLLLALNPFHVWYSQEGRGYALLLFFAVLMGWLLLRLTEDNLDLKFCVLFALSSAGAVWSNMSGLFLWAAMGLGVLIWSWPKSGRQWGLWAICFGGGLLAVTPWVLKAAGIWAVDRLVVGNPTGEALRGESTFSLLALPYTLFTFFFGYSLGPSLRELHVADKLAVLKPALPLMTAAALPVGVGLLSGAIWLRKRALPLLVWVVLPVAILVFLAVRNVKPWNPRYVAVILPWLTALVAHGLLRLPRLSGALLTSLLLGLTLYSLAGYFGDSRYAKADVRAVAAYIDELPADGGAEAAVLVPVVTGVFNYYHRGSRPVLDTFNLAPLSHAQDAQAFVDSLARGHSRLLWVEARPWFFDPGNHLPLALSRRGHLRLVMEAPGAKLYSWQTGPGYQADPGPESKP